MSKYHIEIVISEGSDDNGSDWETAYDAVFLKNNKIDTGNRPYPLEFTEAAIKAVRVLREELENK